MEIEVGRHVASPEDLLQEEVEAAAGRIEGAVGVQVESQRPASGLAELEEDRVPGESPGAGGLRIEGEAVAEEPEAHVPVLAADGIVEVVVAVAHRREAADGIAEECELLAAAAVLLGSMQPSWRRQ